MAIPVQFDEVMRLVGIFLISLVVAAGGRSAKIVLANDNLILQIDKAQEDREARLFGYTVTEHYTIHNSRFSVPADTVVATTYVRGEGKTYHVVSRTGPPFLQTHVLDRILGEEEAMSKGEKRRNALIVAANYEIKLVGQEMLGGRNCDLVELTPRAKSVHLLKGKAWLDAESHMLVRIQGKPTASPAFLAGIPEVVRDYMDVDGFSLARTSHAVSQTFLLGKTDLTIEYTDYRVNSSGPK